MSVKQQLINELPGLETAVLSLLEVVRYPLEHQRKFEHLNIEAPKGVLLYGPPGVGKTRLVREISRITQSELTIIEGSEIIGPYLGESEQKLREKFREAQSKASGAGTSILFIDEIDSLAGSRQKQEGYGANGASARLVAQLLTLMDGVEPRGRLVVIGATNLPNALDSALRRPGRFDREIHVDVPNQICRRKILSYYTSGMPLDNAVDLDALAEMTNGYVGADISALCQEAAASVIAAHLQDSLDSDVRPLTMYDFAEAMKRVIPSLKRGLGIDIAETRWDDIGGLDQVKQTIRRAFEWPQKHKHSMQRLGLRPPRGILMYGPPGCSKTTLVKAVATQEKITFFSINGASIYSPFVGDAERTLRQVFQQARSSIPAVVFFDEVDAIVGKRERGGSSGDSVQERLLSTLLNEMDGVEMAEGVLVIGATNRIDMIDTALLRPGRFDQILYVPPPDSDARKGILQIKTRRVPLADTVDLARLAERTEGFSGADLDNLCREAALLALREDIGAKRVNGRHFDDALAIVQPSLSKKVMEPYERAINMFG
ncbi:P-loop containing nucleoside triphosphate hydrolase protein [Coemansia spiralis]|nr:P-loop containing nucleoside triphosphate hydrolase protein [Coemansia spiralis]